MAFPTIVSSTTATGASSKTFTCLSGFTCAPDEWIVVVVGYDQSGTIATSSAGWSIIRQATDNNFFASALLAKRVTGTTENLNLTATATFASTWSARIFRISGAGNFVSSAPVITSNTSNSVDPAAISFASSTDSIAFCAIVGDGGATTATGPSGYSTVETLASAAGISTCYRTLTAASEDAGVWGSAASFTKASYTFGLDSAPYVAPVRRAIRYSFSF